MTVVSDTSPITSLLKIGKADLLPLILGPISIPSSVYEELLAFHQDLPSWLEVCEVPASEALMALTCELGLGESASIILAEDIDADLLVIDEKIGRRVAEDRGIICIGLLGVLLLGKRRGQIDAIRPLLEELHAVSRFRLSPQVLQAALEAVGETETN